MKVFGIGLSRTGTRSLVRALTILGYKAGHYDSSIKAIRMEGDRVVPVTERIASWDALADLPIAAIYRELYNSFPDAKFILTVRERQAWLDSCQRHLRRSNTPYLKHHGIDLSVVLGLRKAMYGRIDFDATAFSQAYDRHVRTVEAFFREAPEDLLLLDLCGGDDWEKLCAFLGKPVPADVLPHENRSKKN